MVVRYPNSRPVLTLLAPWNVVASCDVIDVIDVIGVAGRSGLGRVAG